MSILNIKFIDIVVQQYFCCFLFFSFCVFLSCILVLLTYIVSPKKKDFEKLSVYECGFEPFNDTRNTFDSHFYIVSVLFIIFDLEIVYLIPWSLTIYSNIDSFGFPVMLVFLSLLILGLIYEWLNGALCWSYWTRLRQGSLLLDIELENKN